MSPDPDPSQASSSAAPKKTVYVVPPLDEDIDNGEGSWQKFEIFLLKALMAGAALYVAIALFGFFYQTISTTNILDKLFVDSPRITLPEGYIGTIRMLVNGMLSLFASILSTRWIVRIICKIDRLLCKR